MLQEPANKRLGLALGVSALIHFFLVGQFYLALPMPKHELHTIEARLQMPKVVVKATEVAKPEAVVTPKPAPVEKPKPIAEPKVEEVAPKEAVAEPPDHSTEIVPEITPQVEPPPAPAENTDPIPTPADAQPVDAGLVINENAYQYVETDFDVRTEIDGSAKGKASITFDLQENKQYQLKWLTQGKGAYAIFLPDLLQTSDGVLTKSGLQPSHYLYQFGDKVDKTYSANFDWLNKKITLQTSKETKTVDLPDESQDLLSFMYQFMYVAVLQRMQISITNGKKITTYDYTFEGEENVAGTIGELKTVHIRHVRDEVDEKTELWLAIDYQYVPVKIRQTKKDGKVYELMVTRINTTRPVKNN
jgi:Protein of unknown function (DUF3108)